MPRTTRIAALAAAVMLTAGCSGQRPTIAPDPAPTAQAEPVEPLQSDLDPRLCAEWTAGYRPDPAELAPWERLSPVESAGVAAGLSLYCARYPREPLWFTVGQVVFCLWPDRTAASPDDTAGWRGPDCSMFPGRP